MTKIKLRKEDLINRANIELECFPGYIEGMKIESARMIGSCLIIGGFCFMDNGGPKEKTRKALEIYSEFAEIFVKKYTL